MKFFACIAAIGLCTSSAFLAQTTIAPPTTGLLVSYGYWPVQYVQWVGAELPYSMIELDVDAGAKQPLYNVVLTGKDGKRVTYANTDTLVAAARAQGSEAYKAQIAFDPADTQAVGAVSTLRMSLADGKPLQWRFIQGSDISEQGAGLTPLPQMPMPVFVYREQAAVAGEGTALQIGNTVSPAEVWTEISKPPYFVAYHGAVSLGAHTTVLAPGAETWTITSSPSEIKPGAAWEMTNDHGDHRTLRIDTANGPHVIIRGTETSRPGVAFVIECSRAQDGWSLERARYAPDRDGDRHFLALQFTPPLTSSSSTNVVDMMIGRKKMAAVSLALSGSAAERTATMTVQSPAWAKGKSLVEQATSSNSTLSIAAKPLP